MQGTVLNFKRGDGSQFRAGCVGDGSQLLAVIVSDGRFLTVSGTVLDIEFLAFESPHPMDAVYFGAPVFLMPAPF